MLKLLGLEAERSMLFVKKACRAIVAAQIQDDHPVAGRRQQRGLKAAAIMTHFFTHFHRDHS
jgi:hypothetical protein